MQEYRRYVTPLGHACDVREVQASDGRRWHAKMGSRSFYLSAARHLPQGADEGQVMRGVLNGVDGELIRDRSMMVPDYEAPLLPEDFD